MDYGSFIETAKDLLTDFGDTIILHHCVGMEYDGDKIIENKKYEDSMGIGVKLGYDDDTLGSMGDIIEAGDVRFVCQLGQEPYVNKDQLIFSGVTYNIVRKKDVSPAGQIIIYILQCRKATREST